MQKQFNTDLQIGTTKAKMKPDRVIRASIAPEEPSTLPQMSLHYSRISFLAT